MTQLPLAQTMKPFAFMQIGGGQDISRGVRSGYDRWSRPWHDNAMNIPSPTHQEILPGLHFHDDHRLCLPVGGLTAPELCDHLFANPPGWISALMTLRNEVVKRLGLEVVEMGRFPVISSSDQEIILGLDDRHLDFRIRIRIWGSDSNGTEASISTLVRLNSFLGRVYLTAVMPFHKAIVRTMLSQSARNISA